MFGDRWLDRDPRLTLPGSVAQDVSRIPTYEDLEPSFSSYIPGYLLKAVRNIGRAIYSHWKDRRLQAGGKPIVPQLNVSVRSSLQAHLTAPRPPAAD